MPSKVYRVRPPLGGEEKQREPESTVPSIVSTDQPPENDLAVMCISDIHRLANEKLETAVRLYYDSGAGEEQTLRENREAFNRLRFRPKLLMDVSRVNTETTLLGSAVSMPVGFAPSVMQQLAHPDGETGTAQAAEAAGTVMILSALSTVSLEEVRHSAPNCTLWLQTFLFKDRALTESLVKRAADAGFSAIVLTVDSPLFGHEMKPSKCRFSLPNNFRLSNLERSLPKTNATAFDLFVDDLISQSGVWSDIAWLRSVSGLPVVVKGVLTPEAAVNSLRSGAAAIIVSNHGGRQLDGTPASIEALPVIVAAVGESLEVYLDSGVRTGADVAKALALGARAVFIGRPVLWGLAYNGKEGVSTVLDIIKTELERTLKLLAPCHPGAAHSDTKETCSTERRVEELVAVEESIRALPRHFQRSCTRSREKPICQLLGQLQAYNDVLWYLGLQLREDETGDAGSLRLVVSSPLTRRWTQKSASLAIRLLVVLFTRHRCLLHVDLTEDIVRNPVLRQSLTNSPGVKKVHVCCYDAIASKVDGIDDLVFRLIPSLEQIEELVFRSRGIRSPSYVTADVFGLKRPDTRLTTIDIAELKLNQPTANRFVAHLARNRTVTSLAVGHEIFSLASFAEYLGKNKPALKRLALRSGRVCNPAVMKRLAGAISTMTALEELTVAVNFTSPQEVGIFAEVVARNKTIKVMSLTQPLTTSDHELPDYSDLSIASLPGTAEAWQPALKENCVLKALTIDFLGFQESDCHCFFRALKENKALTKVTVLNLPTQGDLKAICSTIRHCGLTDKVQITRIHLDSTSIPKLEYCPEVTAVSLSTFSPEMDLPKALGVLDSCGHASSVCLDMDEKFFESTVHGSLSEFIEMADNLTELRLRLHARFSAEMHLGHRVAQSTVVKAISSCTSLTMLELVGFYLANSDCRMLAEAAVRSPYLHHLEVNCHKGNLHFLQHLARIVACSYSLIHVQVPYCDEADQEHFAIQETTRRNSSLIIRAARFVLGDKTTYCARALELVSRHPKLVEMVEDRAAITCGEAKEMIRRALLNIADMDGFMRAAGIVRDKVKCDGDPDGQKQFDQLGDDCWSHVRIYLKISDVLEPPL